MVNECAHNNAPHNLSDTAASIIQALVSANTAQGDALGSMSFAERGEKKQVFRAAGLTTDAQNTYGYVYTVLRKSPTHLRLLFVTYQQHLESLYASRLLCLIATVCGMFFNCNVISQ